jgi:hypothetical protein
MWEQLLGIYQKYSAPQLPAPTLQPSGGKLNTSVNANTTLSTKLPLSPNQVAEGTLINISFNSMPLKPFPVLASDLQALYSRIQVLEARLVAAGNRSDPLHCDYYLPKITINSISFYVC